MAIKLTDEQKKTIGELVGEATMQWQPIPSGVFKAEEANAVLNRIYETIEKDDGKPCVVFEFATKEDRDKWYGAYSNSGEQEVFEYWYQDNEEVPEWKETVEN